MPSGNHQLGFSTLNREVQLDRLPLDGELPAWLTGTLVRTGPAKFEVGEQRYRHWFDGLAMLHRFSFADEQVSYANKFLGSQAYTEAKEKGKISRGEFATDPCRSIFGRVLSFFSSKLTDNANVSITKLGDRYVSVTETPFPTTFDPQTLNTLGKFHYEDRVEGQMTTAHPHFDFDRNALFNYQTHLSRHSSYNIYRMAANGTRQQLVGSVPVDEPAYMHSFGMSEHYIILAEFPFVVNPLKMATRRLRGTPIIENFRWKPEQGTRFLIISKDDGRLVNACFSEPFFAFHHVNAFEQDGEVVLDITAYPDASLIEAFYLKNLRREILNNPTGELRRYHLPLQGTQAKYDTLAKETIEFSRINYRRCNSQPYRFTYGGGNSSANNFIDQLLKVDLQEGKTLIWHEENCYPGEPVFVEAPDASAEDEGVILSVVLDAAQENSFLLVLDARSFQEIARARVPHHIPFGLHGQYFGETQPSPDRTYLHR
jgi:carotenoid cleavage dioxygenase-like enzyme